MKPEHYFKHRFPKGYNVWKGNPRTIPTYYLLGFKTFVSNYKNEPINAHISDETHRKLQACNEQLTNLKKTNKGTAMEDSLAGRLFANGFISAYNYCEEYARKKPEMIFIFTPLVNSLEEMNERNPPRSKETVRAYSLNLGRIEGTRYFLKELDFLKTNGDNAYIEDKTTTNKNEDGTTRTEGIPTTGNAENGTALTQSKTTASDKTENDTKQDEGIPTTDNAEKETALTQSKSTTADKIEDETTQTEGIPTTGNAEKETALTQSKTTTADKIEDETTQTEGIPTSGNAEEETALTQSKTTTAGKIEDGTTQTEGEHTTDNAENGTALTQSKTTTADKNENDTQQTKGIPTTANAENGTLQTEVKTTKNDHFDDDTPMVNSKWLTLQQNLKSASSNQRVLNAISDIIYIYINGKHRTSIVGYIIIALRNGYVKEGSNDSVLIGAFHKDFFPDMDRKNFSASIHRVLRAYKNINKNDHEVKNPDERWGCQKEEILQSVKSNIIKAPSLSS